MDFLSALLQSVLTSPKRLIEEEVKARVEVLDGPGSAERDRFLVCNCASCILARTFIEHRVIVGAFGDDHWSQVCKCHNCCGHQEGWPDRPMPHADCPCEFCTTWREKGAGQLDVLNSTPPESDLPLDILQRAVLGILGIPKDRADQVMGLVTKRRQAREDERRSKLNELLALPPPASEGNLALPPKSGLGNVDYAGLETQLMAQQKSSTEEIEKMFGKTANPMTATAVRETEMTKTPYVENRKPADIGGLTPPKFDPKGTKIVYPEGMSPLEAAEWLLKEHANQEQNVMVNETIDGFPLDSAIALFKALNKEFGWTEVGATPGWFGDTPPDTISVATGINEFTQVPWGLIRMPGIDGYISPCAGHPAKDGHPVLTLHGEVKKKHRQRIADIVQSAREFLRKESIYKGKAIKVKFPENPMEHGMVIETQDMPEFYDTSKVDPREVVFAKSVEEQIKVSLFTPIEHTQACRDAKIPLKRTVLFAGTYGVGKTLTAAVTAQKAPKHNWTFILIESAQDLRRAVDFAKQYEPAVIFCEDIDAVMAGERDIDMDGVLNIVDGIESKGRDLMIVLTTNHPEKINKAMIRPGRVDALIEVTPPDAGAAERLIRVYARDLLDPDANIAEAGKLLDGHKPASVREVVEKAKLAAIAHNEGPAERITPQDLVTAFHIMKPHFDLMSEKPKEEPKTLDAHLKELVTQALKDSPAFLSQVSGTKKAESYEA